MQLDMYSPLWNSVCNAAAQSAISAGYALCCADSCSLRIANCLLQVEAKTPFARWYEPGSHPLPTDEATADMYRAASSLLQQAGYEHYEISNYAKPGFR